MWGQKSRNTQSQEQNNKGITIFMFLFHKVWQIFSSSYMALTVQTKLQKLLTIKQNAFITLGKGRDR